MIEKIYIPTLGRVDNQKTYNNLPEKWQKKTYLVVQDQEYDEYDKSYNLIRLPKEISGELGGISNARFYISKELGDNCMYGVFDDDLKFIERTPGSEKSKKPMDSVGWKYILNTTSEWLDVFAFSGFRQGNLPPTGKEYIESAAVNCGFFFNGKVLPKSDDLDWSLPVCEDIHMVLQLFKMGYNNRVWDKFGYISKILIEGGCNEWRTLELINDTHEKLIS